MPVNTPTRNERLRALLDSINCTPADLAAKVEVDPKTVERWVFQGRTPYPRIAHRVARELDVDVTYLWPELNARRMSAPTTGDELIACYPGRGHLPPALCGDLLASASRRIDIMGDFGLAETVPNLTGMLAERASNGAHITIILADTDSYSAPIDKARARMVEATYRALIGTSNIRVLRYPTALTTTVIRFDDDLLIRTGIDGCPMALSPILHLRVIGGGPLGALYLTSLDCVTESSIPAEQLG